VAAAVPIFPALGPYSLIALESSLYVVKQVIWEMGDELRGL